MRRWTFGEPSDGDVSSMGLSGVETVREGFIVMAENALMRSSRFCFWVTLENIWSMSTVSRSPPFAPFVGDRGICMSIMTPILYVEIWWKDEI